MDERLIEYIHSGMQKGFKPNHIAEVLKQHGHSDNDIKLAVEMATAKYVRQRRKNRSTMAIAGLLVAAVAVVFVLALLKPTPTPTSSFIKPVVQNAVTRVDSISQQIDTKQQTIEQRLEHIEQAPNTEKDQLAAELKDLYAMMKQERAETRQALMDVLNHINSRPMTQEDQ